MVYDLLKPVHVCVEKAKNIFQTCLQNANPMLHPCITTLNDARIEGPNDFFFYEEGVTPGVGRLLKAIDEERMAIGAALGLEIFKMVTTPDYFHDINNALHHLLTLVVGVEFVRMLIDTTPANILEVLTVAITRHVVLSHADPWSNLACIACIGGLFAIRRFLIRRSELKEEMVEME